MLYLARITSLLAKNVGAARYKWWPPREKGVVPGLQLVSQLHHWVHHQLLGPQILQVMMMVGCNLDYWRWRAALLHWMSVGVTQRVSHSVGFGGSAASLLLCGCHLHMRMAVCSLWTSLMNLSPSTLTLTVSRCVGKS